MYKRNIIIISFLLSALPNFVQATTFKVNHTTDAIDANIGDGICATKRGYCTLRAAILEANATAGPDTILLFPGTYYLTLKSKGTVIINDVLTGWSGPLGEDLSLSGDLDIYTEVKIVGVSKKEDAVIVDASAIGERAFHIKRGPVSMSWFTIQNGSSYWGGGIENNEGILTIANLKIQNNYGAFAGGGIYNYPATQTVIRNCKIQNNSTGDSGGGIFDYDGAGLQISGSTIYNNEAAVGGGIYSFGGPTIVLLDSDITGNMATRSGGGIYVHSTDKVLISKSNIENNMAYKSDVIAHGGGADFFQNGDISIYESNIISNAVVSEEEASGGGLNVMGGDNLIVEDTNISSNHAYADGVQAVGGGISIYGVIGDVKFKRSTISENTVQANEDALGGGIYISGVEKITLTNSTISTNTAYAYIDNAQGGGLWLEVDDTSLASTTIVNNLVISPGVVNGGGFYATSNYYDYHQVYIKNTVIAENGELDSFAIIPYDCSIASFYTDVISNGNNLFGDGCYVGSYTTGDIMGTPSSPLDPDLEPLADNGGPTLTHALQSSSPAVDAGDPTGCTDFDGITLIVDQRGETRHHDGDSNGKNQCDIGAYEL